MPGPAGVGSVALTLTTASPALSEDWLYEAGQVATQIVSDQLSNITPLTYLVVLASGLATSLSPCTLSILPLTIGYIGGYAPAATAPDATPPTAATPPAPAAGAQATNSKQQRAGPAPAAPTASPAPATDAAARSAPNPGTQALSFSLGLATTLASLGVLSSLIGSAYGSAVGSGLPIAVSVLAIVMGLNLLEVLPLALPSLDVDTREALQARSLPPVAQAYAAGLVFALAASPCSTPVLATLLGWVATSQVCVVVAGQVLRADNLVS